MTHRFSVEVVCCMLVSGACATGTSSSAPQHSAETAPSSAVAPHTTPPPPATPRRPVADVYQGITVTDDYRWLEPASDSAVKAWSDAQNARTRAYLDGLPERAAIAHRLSQLVRDTLTAFGAPRRTEGGIFVMRYDPQLDQGVLVVIRSIDSPGTAHVVVDPNTDSAHDLTIDWYVPSRDGKVVAASLSRGGSEAGTLFLYDALTGQRLRDSIPRVQYPTGGGSAAWDGDTAIYYTRYPAPGERADSDAHFYQQVYLHRLGRPLTEDRYVVGKEFPRIAEVELQAAGDPRYLLASVQNGDGGDILHWLMNPGGRWTQVDRYEDKIRIARLDESGLYIVSLAGTTRGRVMRLPLDAPDMGHAHLLYPQGQGAVDGIAPGKTQLYVRSIVGGPTEIRAVDLATSRQVVVPVPPVEAAYGLSVLGGDTLLYYATGYTDPGSWYRYVPGMPHAEKVPLVRPQPMPTDIEAIRALAKSAEGTMGPMTIIRRRGQPRDGHSPALLTGYGGYGISMSPFYDPTLRLWLEQGGIYAIANLRGGGEFGEDWHTSGMLTHKQNVFDDFIACAKFLIDSGYTSPARLAITGGSNGGLLMGAVLTQHPELFQAVASEVGIYDMLRVETTPNGAFNVTEYGTVKNPEQFRALYAYSPYHHVVVGTNYPAVFLTTGANDGRVDPYHSRKMAARLQASTTSSRPILLWTEPDAGHGFGTGLNRALEQLADHYAFLFDQLGVSYQPVQGSEAIP